MKLTDFSAFRHSSGHRKGETAPRDTGAEMHYQAVRVESANVAL